MNARYAEPRGQVQGLRLVVEDRAGPRVPRRARVVLREHQDDALVRDPEALHLPGPLCVIICQEYYPQEIVLLVLSLKAGAFIAVSISEVKALTLQPNCSVYLSRRLL